ncbi:hypothetical protein Tco_0917622 [Tanacetum coccineum]
MDYPSMSPPIRRKYHDSVAFATGCYFNWCRRINKSRRCNRKIRVPIAMWPCRVEEKDEQFREHFKITKRLKKIQWKRPRRRDLYGFVDHPQLQQRSHRNEFAPHRLSQPDGNINGWLLEDETKVEEKEEKMKWIRT